MMGISKVYDNYQARCDQGFRLLNVNNRTMLRAAGLLSFVVLIGLSACSVQVTSRYDPKADFNKYKTFCWMEGCEFKIDGPEYLKEEEIRLAIKNTIVNGLAARGLTENADTPDLLVGFSITVKNDTVVVFRRMEESPIYYQPLPHQQDEVPFLRGTLILAMADKSTSQIVWQAAAVEYMENRPKITTGYLERGIRKVMKRFPPNVEH